MFKVPFFCKTFETRVLKSLVYAKFLGNCMSREDFLNFVYYRGTWFVRKAFFCNELSAIVRDDDVIMSKVNRSEVTFVESTCGISCSIKCCFCYLLRCVKQREQRGTRYLILRFIPG